MSEAAKKRGTYIPETPGGTVLAHLEAKTEEKAWANLLRDAAHMPYKGVTGFQKRGYKVLFWEEVDHG
jgi:hypothetical protein